jgi:pimeloyl-ACP methyl ester carboxylesterase
MRVRLDAPRAAGFSAFDALLGVAFRIHYVIADRAIFPRERGLLFVLHWPPRAALVSAGAALVDASVLASRIVTGDSRGTACRGGRLKRLVLSKHSKGFWVIAVDLRGHGKSEPMRLGSYTPADYVADIEALIAMK